MSYATNLTFWLFEGHRFLGTLWTWELQLQLNGSNFEIHWRTGEALLFNLLSLHRENCSVPGWPILNGFMLFFTYCVCQIKREPERKRKSLAHRDFWEHRIVCGFCWWKNRKEKKQFPESSPVSWEIRFCEFPRLRLMVSPGDWSEVKWAAAAIWKNRAGETTDLTPSQWRILR